MAQSLRQIRAGPIELGLLQRAQIPLGEDETIDGICRDEVLVIQRRNGYRYAVDAMLLAAFSGAPRGPVVDLGTGCGIIALLLARRGVQQTVAIEIQPALYQLAYRNVALNRLGGQVRVLHADLRRLKGVLPPGTFELVVANPPYIALRSGVVNPVSERAIARHEVSCSPEELTSAARYLLREGGSLKVIFPASRLADLGRACDTAGLCLRRMRMVHPVPSRPAKMVLFEAIKGRGGRGAPLEVLPPLFLFDSEGGYSEEARQILGDARADPDLLE